MALKLSTINNVSNSFAVNVRAESMPSSEEIIVRYMLVPSRSHLERPVKQTYLHILIRLKLEKIH